MNAAWHRGAACLGWVLGALLLIAGCAQTPASVRLDTLTTPEPDSVRQRAARRLALATAYS